jgi:mono/diheme cytochrome c family protein
MHCKQFGTTVLAAVLAALACTAAGAAQPKASADDVARGEYLVRFGGCDDCHSPKKMTPEGPVPDLARRLSGQPANARIPAVPQGVLGPEGWLVLSNGDLTAWAGPWGVSFAANLTPSKTGLADWTVDQFIKTMRTGKHLGVGRPILPPMPWPSLQGLSDRDLRAIFAYLRSIKPIDNQVPLPIPPK